MMGMLVVKVVVNFIKAIKTMDLLPVEQIHLMEYWHSELEPEPKPQPKPRLTPVVKIVTKPRPITKKKSPALLNLTLMI